MSEALAAIDQPRYGLRHDPATIQAVAAAIEAGDDYAKIASALGISERSIDRIVAENADLASLRAYARQTEARQRAAEGLAIIDAPLPSDPKMASAEATRAKNRADFRKWLSACLDRATYGDAVTVDANVKAQVLVAFVDATSRQVEHEGELDVSEKPPPQPSAFTKDRKSVGT